MDTAQVYLSLGVLIECVWVLRSSYEYAADQVLKALMAVCSLPNVTLERPEVAQQAFLAQSRGVDFADAVHVLTAEADGADGFATFDEALRRQSGAFAVRLKIVPP